LINKTLKFIVGSYDNNSKKMSNHAGYLIYTKVLITPKSAKLVFILKITNFFEKKHKKIQNRASKNPSPN